MFGARGAVLGGLRASLAIERFRQVLLYRLLSALQLWGEGSGKGVEPFHEVEGLYGLQGHQKDMLPQKW